MTERAYIYVAGSEKFKKPLDDPKAPLRYKIGYAGDLVDRIVRLNYDFRVYGGAKDWTVKHAFELPDLPTAIGTEGLIKWALHKHEKACVDEDYMVQSFHEIYQYQGRTAQFVAVIRKALKAEFSAIKELRRAEINATNELIVGAPKPARRKRDAHRTPDGVIAAAV